MRSSSHLEKQANVELRQVRKEKSWQNEEKYLGTLNAVSCLKVVDVAGGCFQGVAGKAAWRDRLRTVQGLLRCPNHVWGGFAMLLRPHLLRTHCAFDTAFVRVSKNRCCSLRARFPLLVTLLVSTKITLYLVTSQNGFRRPLPPPRRCAPRCLSRLPPVPVCCAVCWGAHSLGADSRIVGGSGSLGQFLASRIRKIILVRLIVNHEPGFHWLSFCWSVPRLHCV